MVNKKFEAYKIEREIKRSGGTFTLLRMGTNDVGEPNGIPEVIGKFCGLYHEQNSSISINTGDTTQTRTKKIPSILCLLSELEPFSVCVGDIISFDTSKTFKVTGIVDIQEWHIVADVSLEVVDDGK